MTRTAINLYSVRSLDEPTLTTLERVADAGYDGVQFSGGLGDATPGEVADALDGHGLAAVAPHVGIDALEDDLDAAVEPFEPLGVDGVVVPWLDAECFEDREAALATAERLDDLAATAGRRELAVHYHNHDHEFVDLGDETAFEAFADASGTLLELDVGWVETAGYDPAALLERYADRVGIVHMKDMADGEFVEIGDGDVDMAACAAAAREGGAEWLVYEHDEPADPVASIDAGAAFLDGL